MAISNGYATLNQVKASLRIQDNLDDDLLELAIESASRQIDSHCERFFYSTSATRVYAPQDSYYCETDDIVSITTLKTSSLADGQFDTTWAASDYEKLPLNGIAGGLVVPFNSLKAVGDYLFPLTTPVVEATVQIQGVFGFSAVPTAIKQATVILASRIFKRNDSPLGVAGFGDLGAIRVSRVDADVEALIQPYKKVRFA
jgi:uncharacterized phage protein (predicted DNA packaging)